MHAEIQNREIGSVTRSPGYVGIWLFLASETMLFVGLFGAYFVLRNENPLVFAAGPHELSLPRAIVATVMLLLSSMAMYAAVRSRNISRAKIALLTAAVLGILFLILTAMEFSSLLSSAPHNAFFDCFFTLTGVHAAHVFMGVLAMLVLLPKVPQPALKYLGLYWQFVDCVWIFLFFIFFVS
jgi:heme/copper-type cytochrome/quinol oxidase subunit 3